MARKQAWIVLAAIVVILLFSLYLYHGRRVVIARQTMEESIVGDKAALTIYHKIVNELVKAAQLALNAQDEAFKSSKRRTADTLSPNANIHFELKQAKLEQRSVAAMEKALEQVRDRYGELLSILASRLGNDQVQRVREELTHMEASRSIEYANWDHAVTDVVNDLTLISEGGSSPSSGSDIEHFYQGAADAKSRADTLLREVGDDTRRLRMKLEARLHQEQVRWATIR